jgi:hypothetical protein
VATHASRWSRKVPLRKVHIESVKFDMQALENPDISGEEYQNGTLAGWELWEYLLERDGRKCAYCDREDVPLEREHVVARANGGSNRVSNLVCSCERCNKKKKALDIEVFLKDDPERLKKIKARLKTPLRDAAAVNSTRKAVVAELVRRGFSVLTWTGGRTKHNRTRLNIPKAHALDALCVGKVDAAEGWNMPVLQAQSTGRGQHARTIPDKYGFKRLALPRRKTFFGFRTGDMVRAVVKKGKKVGTYVGRVSVRSKGSFNITTAIRTVEGIGWKCCRLIQRADGYRWSLRPLMSCLQKKR